MTARQLVAGVISRFGLVRAGKRRPEVVVYTRAGCGLCRRAEALVAREVRHGHVRVVDVDGDDELVRRYGVRVPVVTVNGREVAELQLARGVVAAAVRRARRSTQAEQVRHRRP